MNLNNKQRNGRPRITNNGLSVKRSATQPPQRVAPSGNDAPSDEQPAPACPNVSVLLKTSATSFTHRSERTTAQSGSGGLNETGQPNFAETKPGFNFGSDKERLLEDKVQSLEKEVLRLKCLLEQERRMRLSGQKQIEPPAICSGEAADCGGIFGGNNSGAESENSKRCPFVSIESFHRGIELINARIPSRNVGVVNTSSGRAALRELLPVGIILFVDAVEIVDENITGDAATLHPRRLVLQGREQVESVISSVCHCYIPHQLAQRYPDGIALVGNSARSKETWQDQARTSGSEGSTSGGAQVKRLLALKGERAKTHEQPQQEQGLNFANVKVCCILSNGDHSLLLSDTISDHHQQFNVKVRTAKGLTLLSVGKKDGGEGEGQGAGSFCLLTVSDVKKALSFSPFVTVAFAPSMVSPRATLAVGEARGDRVVAGDRSDPKGSGGFLLRSVELEELKSGQGRWSEIKLSQHAGAVVTLLEDNSALCPKNVVLQCV